MYNSYPIKDCSVTPSEIPGLKIILALFSNYMDLSSVLFFPPENKTLTAMLEGEGSMFCSKVHKYVGIQACEDDQKDRAKEAVDKGHSEGLCFAGMWNWSYPLMFEGQNTAILHFGGKKLRTCKEKCRDRFEQFLQEHPTLSEEAVAELRKAFDSTETIDQVKTELLNDFIAMVLGLFKTTQELKMEKTRNEQTLAEQVHELALPMQAIAANSEQIYRKCEIIKREYTNHNFSEGLLKLLDYIGGLSDRTLRETILLNNELQNIQDAMESPDELSKKMRFNTGSLSSVVEEVVELYDILAEKKGVEIKVGFGKSNKTKVTVEDEEAIIKMSAQHLRRAFGNLINNAIKYSYKTGDGRERHVDVRIWRHSITEYAVSISNFGIGITKEELGTELIFKPGYRGKWTKGEHRPGAGFGLYVAREIIKPHGGGIYVHSEDKGSAYLTTVTVRLPMAAEFFKRRAKK